MLPSAAASSYPAPTIPTYSSSCPPLLGGADAAGPPAPLRGLSLPRLLKNCAGAVALPQGRQLHALSYKLRLSSDLYVQTSLLSMYASCGQLDDALRVFDRMPHRNIVAWTAAVDACIRSDRPGAAVSLFLRMLESGMRPDRFAIVSLLSACAHLGALDLGRAAHGYVEKDAEFSGVQPNELTFLALLCGCSHAGLVDEGRHYFDMMRTKYGIAPGVKHYSCMVDMLGRAGLLDEALQMALTMPAKPNHIIWGSLLSACRIHKNLSLAEQVMEIAVGEGCPVGDTSHYVIMSSMYREAELVEKMASMRTKVGRKPQGKSWIEVGSSVYEFGVRGNGGHSYPMWGELRTMLEQVEEKAGDGKVENPLDAHSEKTALAFGLLKVRGSAPVRISKNLRICEDCHSLMKSVSRVYKREIVIRDCTRFHRFTEGQCSCHDYW
ncbi:hypothetical protein Taro_016448 [Colocasia esculenta]|uniref:DYW domain-containing protein n=1 Tax=Colocasia esculenta TaxID=4460 RepID=A0A843UNI8_COLES|nr:hypothetical protein [Colocasia esculenta]